MTGTMTIRYEDADYCTDCGHAGECGCPHDCTPAGADYRATAEGVIARLRTDPEFLADNAGDGGEAAFGFIRNARARNEQRTPAEKDASRRAQVERVLAAMREGR